MDLRTRKLGHVLRDNDTAAALVAAGLDTPAKLKAATDQQIRAVRGIGQATLARIREKCPKL